LPLYFHLEKMIVFVPPHSQISASVAVAENCRLFGAGELILIVLAVALLRCLLYCLSRALSASCNPLKRALTVPKSRRRTPAVKRQPRAVRVKAADAPSFENRRTVDAREALRRSCAAAPNRRR
jgi:hypothetical protein